MSDCIAHTDSQLAVQKQVSNIKLESLPADLRCLLIPGTTQMTCLGLVLLVTEFHPQLLQSMFLLPINRDTEQLTCEKCCVPYVTTPLMKARKTSRKECVANSKTVASTFGTGEDDSVCIFSFISEN